MIALIPYFENFAFKVEGNFDQRWIEYSSIKMEFEVFLDYVFYF